MKVVHLPAVSKAALSLLMLTTRKTMARVKARMEATITTALTRHATATDVKNWQNRLWPGRPRHDTDRPSLVVPATTGGRLESMYQQSRL